MKLTLREAQNIADLYDLGKVKKIKYFPSGWVNYNYFRNARGLSNTSFNIMAFFKDLLELNK